MSEGEIKKRTFTDMLNLVTDTVKKSYSFKEWEEVIVSIDNIVLELNGLGESGKNFQDFSVDELSRMGAKLSILQFNIIEIQKHSYQQIKIAESQYDIRISQIRQTVKESLNKTAQANGEKSPTVDDINYKVDSIMSESKLLINLHQAEYESLKNKYFSITNILHRIETRIKYLNSSLGDSGTSHFVGDSRDLSQGVLYDFDMPSN